MVSVVEDPALAVAVMLPQQIVLPGHTCALVPSGGFLSMDTLGVEAHTR